MALIKCDECGKEISSNAAACPHCGNPIKEKKEDVAIRFPIWVGQFSSTKCFVYDKKTKEVIAEGRQGEVVTFECKEPIEIFVKVKGAFGKPSVVANPGDRFEVSYRGVSVIITKVDAITGSPNVSGNAFYGM